MAEGLTKKQIKELRKLEKLQSRNLEQKNNSIKWIAITVVSVLFLVLFVGTILIAKNKDNQTVEQTAVSFSDAGHDRMITQAGEEATASADPQAQVLTIVEFADLQCPACKAYHPMVKELLQAYPDRVKLKFKHFPLVAIHKNAMPSALASEAAGRQGKFFEFVDMAYEKQGEWSELPNPQGRFEEYAQAVGLDLEQFRADQKDKALEATINAQREEGITNGVSGTPTFFIGGERIQNPATIEDFKKEVDQRLNSQRAPAGQNPEGGNTVSPTSAPDSLPLQ